MKFEEAFMVLLNLMTCGLYTLVTPYVWRKSKQLKKEKDKKREK